MNPILQLQGISKSYTPDAPVLSEISLQIGEGECVGLVGGSGSGKSTLARLILGLERPDSGSILFGGTAFHRLKGKELREARKGMQIIFQDPTASLNPRIPVGEAVVEFLDNYPAVKPAFLHQAGASRRDQAALLLEMVGLSASILDSYPHQLSGGQRQRVAIARSISLHPRLLICDEPTSSLDVSVGAQILNLLKDLNERFSMSFLFISHDMAAVRFMCSRIAVLSQGVLVDEFPAEGLFSPERHPYTRRMVELAAR